MKTYIKPTESGINLFALAILIAFVLGLFAGKVNAQNGVTSAKTFTPKAHTPAQNNLNR